MTDEQAAILVSRIETNTENADACTNRIVNALDSTVEAIRMLADRHKPAAVTLEADTTQAALEIIGSTNDALRGIAVAIDRLTATVKAEKPTPREAHRLAENIEAMCTGKGSLSAAPSQTRAMLLGAASILRRC